jgi:hypothetical protein
MTIEEKYNNVIEKYKSILANIFERISVAENKLKQFENKENRLNSRKSDSIILFVNKKTFPSSNDGEH